MHHRNLPPAAPVFAALIASFLFHAFAPAPAGAHALAISPDGHRLYVTSPSGGIDVIDTETDALLTKLPIEGLGQFGGAPAPLAPSPDGRLLYSAVGGLSARLFVIDLATGKLAATISAVGPERSAASDLAVSPDGGRLYLLVGDPFTSLSVLSVVDTALGKVVAEVPVFGVSEALTPDGRKLYVAGGYSGLVNRGVVSVVDTSTNSLTRPVSVQPLPGGIAASPNGRRMYVTHNDPASQSVDLIDTVSDTLVTATTAFRGGESMAPVVSPDGKRLYLLPFLWDASGVVGAINTTNGEVVGSVSIQDRPIDQVVSPSADRLYVLNRSRSHNYESSISVVDTTMLHVIATISLK